MTPLEIALLSSVLTAAVIVPIMMWQGKRGRHRADQDMMRTMRKIANERTESQVILASLDFGIIAYGSDDRLIASNPVALEALSIIPDTLSGFLDRFGTDNGMRAAYYLGSDDVSGEISLNNRFLRLVCQQRPVRSNGQGFGGHVITAQDFTQIRRQEERRKDFVANVSHELKTPLTTMKSYSETLLDWGIDEKERDEIKTDVARIYDDSIRMERLITDLLLLSSIDSSGVGIQATLFDLTDCARQISDRLAAQALDKDISLGIYSMTRGPVVFADKSSIERILTNLLVNAIRYSRQGGRVEVYIGTVVDDVYVKVKDNGIGIIDNELANIFERFYRVDKTGSRQFGGTGLGLSIAQELAKMHHGRIEVESEHNLGSQFTLFLPSATRFLQKVLIEFSHKEKPQDEITRAAAILISSWLGEQDGADLDGTEALDLRTLLEIINEKVNNSMDISSVI
ncbi:MAG: cell wall metabolism sensor histidine kinase WalK [Clostridiaceae bacterium]|jgi:two-component system sensor histidine kinase VicK|nr:cell wall metabolism sensor histidine kinase WalK [Clostridiaceae bacterium]